MKTVIYWNGSGYYAPNRWEVNETQVYRFISRDPFGVFDKCKDLGVGTPMFVDSTEDFDIVESNNTI